MMRNQIFKFHFFDSLERSHASDSIDEIHIENIPDGLETEEI
jgi:hypothetical protein